jgi:hypothetical protein
MSKLVTLHQKRISKTCIGSNSTFGSLESGGLNSIRQNLCIIINLSDISSCKSDSEFKALLDSFTSKLKQKLSTPVSQDHWGICRKAINLYLRDCYYNKILNEHFKLDKIAAYLETPIDSLAMKSLGKYTTSVKKSTIKALNKTTHQEWQKAATLFSKANSLPYRVDADLEVY